MSASIGESVLAGRGDREEEVARVLRRAEVLWRRAGVQPGDRAMLLAELDAELQAAAGDGAPVSSVVGGDMDSTLRAWATARGLAGRSLRAGVLVPVTLAGVLIGSATLVALLVVDFGPLVWPMSTSTVHGGLVLTICGSSAVMSVLVPVLGCWAALQAGRDPLAGATARWLVLTVPLGEVAALALGVGAAAVTGFAYAAFPGVVLVVLATMACAALAGRVVAVRRAADAARPAGDDASPTW